MANWQELLEQYNPALLIFPHDTTQTRPGALRLAKGTRTWGDYHPCSVDFYLSLIHLDVVPPPFDLFGFFKGWQPLPVTPIDIINREILAVPAGATRGWDFDIARIPSQKEDDAWREYGSMIAGPSPLIQTVYGRCVEGREGRLALQYWYLYVYNDFGNKHEGDWEMAVIELNAAQCPVMMGLSRHAGGAKLQWEKVRKENGRPVVYVGRGSHAGYFRYRHGGYDASLTGLSHGFNLPAGLGFLKLVAQLAARIQALRIVQQLPFVKIWRDHVPAWTVDRAPQRDRVSETVVPQLRRMDDAAQKVDVPPWMRFDGSWGSCHVRVNGRTGPDSPWQQGTRWTDPLGWLEDCADDAEG
jgi:hypothetical protein